jgi:hypothetical protein
LLPPFLANFFETFFDGAFFDGAGRFDAAGFFFAPPLVEAR